MDENRLEGTARNIGGKVESLAGDITGDTKLKADGAMDKAGGKVQRAYGQAKDTVKDAVDSISSGQGSQLLDQVEEYGDMIAEKIDERPITSVLIAAGHRVPAGDGDEAGAAGGVSPAVVSGGSNRGASREGRALFYGFGLAAISSPRPSPGGRGRRVPSLNTSLVSWSVAISARWAMLMRVVPGRRVRRVA